MGDSHWKMDDDGHLELDWGNYGKYEFMCDASTKSMSGSAKGEPTKWRKASFLRGLSMDTLNSVPAHDHGHVHDENCNHH